MLNLTVVISELLEKKGKYMPEAHILLVEDDAIQRRQIVRVLNAEGYQVSESSTGEDAIRQLREEKITLVLTDKLMPDLDGLELVSHIREHYPNVPVIIMTGDPIEKMGPEPDALLTKPFSGRDLKAVIRSLLAKV
jgi:two-component system aerobic respiration control protein ArcA